MNETLQSQVSAFIDGELSAGESELLIRRLSHNGELRELADRYIRIGRMIRGEGEVDGLRSLRDRVAAAIESEELPPPVERPARRVNLLRPAAGVAIAAAVAVVALMGLRQIDVGIEPGRGTAAADLAAVAIDDVPLYTVPVVEDLAVDRPGDMLRRYYLHHGERSADLGANSILSRLVTLELREGDLVEVGAAKEEAADTEDRSLPAPVQ